MKISRKILQACFFAILAHTHLRAAPEGSNPNIIVIMADDQGYGDLGCYHERSNEDPKTTNSSPSTGISSKKHHTENTTTGSPRSLPKSVPFMPGIFLWSASGFLQKSGQGKSRRYELTPQWVELL